MSEREDDLEQQTIDLHFQEAMNNVKKMGTRLNPKGECYNCEEPMENPNQLFCDCDCREDFEKRKRAENHRLY